MTFPKSIKKFLHKCWNFKEKDIKEELLETEHYIVWYCGIDHIVDRTKTPDSIVVDQDFYTYILDKTYKKTQNVVITFKDDINFFYKTLTEFVEKYYGGQPFEVRVIHIPDGMYYLEFKLDNQFSYVYQQVWNLDEEDVEKLETFTYANYKEPTLAKFNEVFKKINLGDDMLL